VRMYVHWPFCISRCAYCDFTSRVAGRRTKRDYMLALLQELDAWARILSEKERRLDSIYLGGGTPSVLCGDEIASLLHEIASRFNVHDAAEVTVEVNPATWKGDDFADACAGGVNRISIGVQSLSDRQLTLLGRAHDAEAAMKAVESALGCGAGSVSVDLLYGLPDMDTASLLGCLDGVLETGVHHVSIYALTLAERTRLSTAVARGEIVLPGEEETADQFLAAARALREKGYEHYEISNFSLPGHHSRHNLAYWRREEYLGIGAGAHSFLGRYRFHNTDSVLEYTRLLARGQLALAGCEALNEKDELAEEIMLGLRTAHGVHLGDLGANEAYLDDMEDGGFLVRDEGRARLTDLGMLVSNALIVRLLPA
jgi:oxygen-independent coproporphyrinogen-3 oxidase